MKSSVVRLGLAVVVVLIVLCCSCGGPEKTAVDSEADRPVVQPEKPEARPVDVAPPRAEPRAVEPKPVKPPVVEAPVEQSAVVAEIGAYSITKGELEKKMIMELRGVRDISEMEADPIDAEGVLLKMLAEKAMIIEGREGDLLKDDSSIRQFFAQKIVGQLVQNELQGKIVVTDSEIQEKLKSNPKLDQARAKAAVEGEKRRKLVDDFYNALYEKRNVKKVRRNFPKVAEVHQRLLYRPVTPRKEPWIRNSQMREEISEEEKETPLATFDGGKVTLSDWFEALGMMAPPRRPKNLGTVEGIEGLLDGAMRMPVFVAEAKSRGLDKDENLLKDVSVREERILLNRIRRRLFDELEQPTAEQIKDYFAEHKEEFGTGDRLKLEQIWCVDYKTAVAAKEELDAGGDFESVRVKHSLKKKDPAVYATVRSEGALFADLWEGEPGEIVGPVMGFYDRQLKWRIVKIVEKKPGQMQEYSDKIQREVKSTMRRKQRNAAVEKYGKQLLEKYSYKIYEDRLRSVDLFRAD